MAALLYYLLTLSGIGGLFVGAGYWLAFFWLWGIFPLATGLAHLVLAFVWDGFFLKGLLISLFYFTIPWIRGFILWVGFKTKQFVSR